MGTVARAVWNRNRIIRIFMCFDDRIESLMDDGIVQRPSSRDNIPTDIDDDANDRAELAKVVATATTKDSLEDAEA